MRRFATILIASALFVTVGCDDKAKKTPKAEEPAAAKADAGTEAAKPEKAEAKSGSDLPLFAKGPVAKIDDTTITAEQFNAEMSRLKSVASRIPPSAAAKFKESTVNRLIDQNLVEKELDKQGLKAEDAEIDEQMAEFLKNMGGEAGVERFFAQTGMTRDDVRKDMVRAIQLEKLLKKKYGIAIDDAAAKKFYDENIQRFTKEEQVQASHILIKVEKDAADDVVKEKKKTAKGILKKTKAKGADFAALAKEFSEGPTASRGGDLGYFAKKRMVPAFAEAAFKTKPGKIVGPVRTEFGFHIIKVVDHKEANVQKFEEVKGDIVKNLERNEMRDSTQKLVEELRKGAKIETMDDNIEVNIKAPAMPAGMPPGMKMPGGHPPMPTGKPPVPPPAPKPTPAPPTK